MDMTRMTPPRRAKLVLLVLAVAIVGLGVWAWKPVWLWATTRHVYVEMRRPGWSPQRGWKTVLRWSGEAHGRMVLFDPRTGWKVIERRFAYGEQLEISSWDGGSVAMQVWLDDSGTRPYGYYSRRSPPWLWGATDETAPSIPEWMKDDEKWAKALEEAR